jgi:superfamily II DNA/RNA helicase
MLDMGFISDVNTILNKTPKKRQTLLFSATVSQPVKALANKLLKNHQLISVAKQNAIADTVEHLVYPVGEHQKADLFIELIEQHNWFKVLVFTSTKKQADELMAKLKPAKIKTALCHGDKSQGARRRAIADFKADKIQVLIATEVAARGLDIKNLDQVINYNLPYLAEDYVHRVGRTGRAGNKGQAISFVSREEERSLNSIERLIGERIKRIKVLGYSVGSRDTILNNLTKRKTRTKTNKATQTDITSNKAGTAKAKKRKTRS